MNDDAYITLDEAAERKPFSHREWLFDRVRSAAHCRCTPRQFSLFVKAGLLPDQAMRGKWKRADLDTALAAMDIHEHGFVTSNEVYFIELGNFVKIGFSGSPRLRLKDLQTGSPYDLKLLYTFPGGEVSEGMLHELWRSIHCRGEWFHKTPALLAYIEWLRTR